jgi:hypothetical protein
MYSKKEEWIMILSLFFSFFTSNHFIKMYIQSPVLFTLISTFFLYISGALIITIMEHIKQSKIKRS